MADGLTAVELRDGDLLLRPWRPGDASQVLRACQDPDIQRWTTVPVPYTEQDAAGYVAASPDRWAAGTASFAAVDAAAGELLGSFDVVGVSEDGDAEIGYWVAPWARRRGVATSSTRLLCRWLLEDLGVPRVVWRAVVGNVASRRVAESAGFVVEGTARQGLVHRGERVDAWVASLLPRDLERAAAVPRTRTVVAGWPAVPVALPTPRLLLRPYRPDDAAALLGYARDPVVAQWDPEGLADLAAAEERARRRADWSDGRAAAWVVADPEDREVLGGVSLHQVDAQNASAEVGYGLTPEGRGRGLAVEAVAAVSEWAFGTLALERIELLHAVGNAASCRVAERVGYRLEGVSRRSFRYGDGELHDEHRHARLATDPPPSP